MSDKNLLMRVLRGDATPRPAWVPFVGVHGAALLGKTAREQLNAADVLVEGQLRAAERYAPDGLPVAFDLQLEAEALGCRLVWNRDTPPSVASHPLASLADLSTLPPFDPTKGRLPVIAAATERLHQAFDGRVGLYGLVTGPFTLLSHLRGSDLFLDMLTDPEGVLRAMRYCSRVGKQSAAFYLNHGCDVVAVVDPVTSQISPGHFEDFVLPAVNGIFDYVHAQGAPASLFVCGDATRNLGVMCRTHCDNISIDENIPLDLARKYCDDAGKSLGGNLHLTSVLLLGTPDESRLNAIECIDHGGRAGFILSPGCDLPYATPPENIEAVAEMVHDAYRREVARTTLRLSEAGHADLTVALPDYALEPEVVLDCVTLDSGSCAPCKYMVEAARNAATHTDVPVRVVEHKITTREGLGVMVRLGIKSIPSICIDGVPAFSSLIPDVETLVQRIERQYGEKSSILSRAHAASKRTVDNGASP